MEIEVKPRFAEYKAQANQLFDKILIKSDTNFEALYGKSLILFQEGKIEESAEVFKNVLKVEENHNKVSKLQDNLIALLKPSPPKTVVIMEELEKTYGTIPMIGHIEKKPGSSSKTNDIPYKQKEKSFYCIICNKTFSKMFGLKRHLLIHQGVKDYKCDVCQRCFLQKSDLERHKFIHKDTYDFKCSHEGCLKQFKTKKSMKSHVKTHDVGRGKKCEFCCRVYMDKKSLRAHVNIHLGIFPFSCDSCGKKFSNKSALISHLQCHTTEKPFKCHLCPSTFKRNFDRRVHMRMVHQVFYEAKY